MDVNSPDQSDIVNQTGIDMNNQSDQISATETDHENFVDQIKSANTDSAVLDHALLYSTFGDQLKTINEHVTFLTHQVVQLMQVLCIANCRCPLCISFIGSAKFPQTLMPNSFTTENNLLHEQNVADHHNNIRAELAQSNSMVQDDEDDDDDELSVVSSSVHPQHQTDLSAKRYNNHHNQIKTTVSESSSIEYSKNDTTNLNNDGSHVEMIDGDLSNGFTMEESFVPNSCALPVLSSRNCTTTANNGFLSAIKHGRRPVVGVDQLLPKLLAEHHHHNQSGQLDQVPRHRRSESPQAENLVCRRRLASPQSAEQYNLETFNDSSHAIESAPEAMGAVNLMKPAAAEHRALMRKRRRLMENQNDVHAMAALHSIDNTNVNHSERNFFNNRSPCSSGGSLELPKSSAEAFIPPEALRHSEPIMAGDTNCSERDPRFSYLQALGPAMSAGLPLIMPGPKATTFFCTICNREFSNVYYKRHMIVHANSRPYVCDVCGKRFNERSNMMKHKQRLHESTSS